MNILSPFYKIISDIDSEKILKSIEYAGRICYKSENKIVQEGAMQFVKNLIKNGHESVLEHEKISVLFFIDRGVSHEIVRHRIASFSQESTRYCNYSHDKFDNEITVIDIKKHFKSPVKSLAIWINQIESAEKAYFDLLDAGESPQIARSVLPNSLKTEILVTANLREWRTIFKQRASPKAHPQMQEIMVPLLENFKCLIPVIFDDL